MKVPGVEFGEAAFQVKSRQRALHQALSLCRASFRVHHSLTFDTVGGEEGREKHGILDSRWSFFTVLPVNLVKTIFYISGTLPQPSGEKMIELIIEGLATFLARLSLAFSHALNSVTITTNPIYLVQLVDFPTPPSKLSRQAQNTFTC